MNEKKNLDVCELIIALGLEGAKCNLTESYAVCLQHFNKPLMLREGLSSLKEAEDWANGYKSSDPNASLAIINVSVDVQVCRVLN